jgi:23S rRNA pseudouridine2605 synthase
MKERIQKVLANAGVASRRQVEQMVLQGRISVNDRTVAQLPVLVDAEKDRIEVDGERVKLGTARTEKRYYFLLHKPRGVYSTNVSQGVQVRAIDLLPQNLRARLYPVGRLDADSRGLLLLTNDGELTNQLTHPSYGVAKTYRAVVEGAIEPGTLDELQKGIWLADREGKAVRTGRSFIRIVRRTRFESILEITIREGRNRQVRRMLARLGHKVKDLMRVRMGPLTLEGLAQGQFRELTPREVKDLKKLGRAREERLDAGESGKAGEAAKAGKSKAGRPARQAGPGRPRPAASPPRPKPAPAAPGSRRPAPAQRHGSRKPAPARNPRDVRRPRKR